mmetsp:Transcript_26413/g.69401  ORF Transcript_26413/g.69401 Transcript_26413/m.69401 type:complete len:82 (-) Transcript_26413:23-268(-)
MLAISSSELSKSEDHQCNLFAVFVSDKFLSFQDLKPFETCLSEGYQLNLDDVAKSGRPRNDIRPTSLMVDSILYNGFVPCK